MLFKNKKKKGWKLKKMENKVLNGKIVSDLKRQEIKDEIEKIYLNTGKRPKLATILVGNDDASKTYVKMKEKTANSLGIETVNFYIETSTTEEIVGLIKTLNEDTNVNGILVQHPLPKNINEYVCFNEIAPEKDVDGVTSINFGKMAMGEDTMLSCTPKGIIDLLDYYGIDVEGKTVTIIGRSPILGKPVTLMLSNRNATVILAHSYTHNLTDLTRMSDIIVACVGISHFVKKEWIKDGVILIDAGYKDGLGDVDPECYEKSACYTPVPKGVGAMTITELMEQTVTAFKQQNKVKKLKKVKL